MMTAKEAWEAGLPGTYMNGEYFPAPFCLRCLGNPHDHPGCVRKYWERPWVPDMESPQ